MVDVNVEFVLGQEEPIEADFLLEPDVTYTADIVTTVLSNKHPDLIGRDLPNQHPIGAITGLEDALDTINSNLSYEIQAREQADTRLEGLIEAEETRAKSVEEQLSDDIVAENTRALGAEENLQDNIDAEEERAKQVEQGLSEDISSESEARASEITRVEGLISAEQTARINADSTLQGNINAEKTARESADNTLQSNIDSETLARQNADKQLQSNIDTEASTRATADTSLNTKIDNHINDRSNPHQVTKAQVGLGNVDNTADIDKPISNAVSSAFDAVEEEINTINSKIPTAASSSNQLADKNFVNSSIATNTANFIGTFNSVAELEAYSGPLTNNDYAFVVGVDSVGNTVYDRYKWNGTEWLFEYELNNSSFTSAQWESINSGANTTKINQISTNQGNIATINATIGGYGNIVTHNVNEFATASQGTKADTAVQPSDLSTVATTGSYNDLDDKPTIGNATLTIQKNGTNIDTFTANATADKSINITVPTATSDLTNDSGFITSSDLPTNYVTTNTAQDISAKKTFLGEKAILFKQTATTDKLGFTLYNTSGSELGALEYRPNTISGGALINLNTSQSGTSWLGFRYWSNINIIAPKPSNGNYYIPVNVTNGSTTVKANNAGTLNISTLIPTVGNGTIIINQGGTQKGTFTVNQSGDTTINLDSGGGTVDQTYNASSTNAQSGTAVAEALSGQYAMVITDYTA